MVSTRSGLSTARGGVAKPSRPSKKGPGWASEGVRANAGRVIATATPSGACGGALEAAETWEGTVICGMRPGLGVVIPSPVLARSAEDVALGRALDRVRKILPPTTTMGGRTPKGGARDHPIVAAVRSGRAFRGGNSVVLCICDGAFHGASAEFIDARVEGVALTVRWRRRVPRGSVQVVNGETGFCAAALAHVPTAVVDICLEEVP